MGASPSRAGLVNVEGPVRNKKQDQNESPNDRVLFNFCQLLKIENVDRPDKDLSKVTLLVSHFAIYTLVQK